MKLLSLLFLSIILGKGCEGDAQQDITKAKIEYVANTRGFYRKIIVENQEATITTERNSKEKPVVTKITDEDWGILAKAFEELNLEELKDLKSPTEKRLYDGAAIAHLKVTYKGYDYESSAFDHGIPPYEIKKIVNKINSFVKQNDEY